MFKLHVLQAKWGDSLLLEFGEDRPKYILVDGGPKGAYEANLEKKLGNISSSGGVLDLVILTHVDSDHVEGLLKLTNGLKESRPENIHRPIRVVSFWHNSFSDSLGVGSRVESLFTMFRTTRAVMIDSDPKIERLVTSISQGDQLAEDAKKLDIPRNQNLPRSLVCSDDKDSVTVDDMVLHIIGPTRENLSKLEQEWEKWLEEEGLAVSYSTVMSRSEVTVPNLSSIMILAEYNGKSILLTGDGHVDDLTEGLEKAGLLRRGETITVDVMKVPHHGSRHNVTSEFFKRVMADIYVISASGRYGHPNIQTLEYIVQAAKADNRSIKILATNETSKMRELCQKYGESSPNHSLKTMPKTENCIVIDCLNGTSVFEKVK
jgi:hypothetical protein